MSGSINPPPAITAEVFAEWRDARRGTAQAEVMTNPLWAWMAETGHGPYVVNEYFSGPSSAQAGPGWTAERFGQSTTVLTNGTGVSIGGEHEDYYDADFFIYNDVIVRDPAGRIEIYGYDERSFPPTDFHSATVIGDSIVVIGNLGYPDRRGTDTQVLVLDLASMRIRTVPTTGPNPGWLHGHAARLDDAGRVVVSGGRRWIPDPTGIAAGVLVENTDDWELDADFAWRRVTDRPWQQWRIQRFDGAPSGLWKLRTAALIAGGDGSGAAELADLYSPPVPYRAHAGSAAPELNVHRIRVDDVVLRFVEDMGGVAVIVEGDVESSKVAIVLDDIVAKLTAIDTTAHHSFRLA